MSTNNQQDLSGGASLIVDEQNAVPQYIAHSRTKSNQTSQNHILNQNNSYYASKGNKLINASHGSHSSHQKFDYGNPYFPSSDQNSSVADQMQTSKSSMLPGQRAHQITKHEPTKSSHT